MKYQFFKDKQFDILFRWNGRDKVEWFDDTQSLWRPSGYDNSTHLNEDQCGLSSEAKPCDKKGRKLHKVNKWQYFSADTGLWRWNGLVLEYKDSRDEWVLSVYNNPVELNKGLVDTEHEAKPCDKKGNRL